MATKEVEAAPVEEAPVATDEKRIEEKAESTIRIYSLGVVGAGFIPLPFADLATISAIQLKMIHSLSKLYGVKFSSNLGKSTIASLTSSLAAEGVGRSSLVASMTKLIPFIGPVVGAYAVPLTAGAATYAVGKVFVQHFESGGTFLDLKPETVKAYFAEQFEKGKLVVSKTKT